MSLTIHLPLGVVAALITATEYLLSLLAALSARATLHGVWLLSLHRGGSAAIDTRTRTRRALRKDTAAFLLTFLLVIAAAGVETNLQPTWVLNNTPRNSTFCVSVAGRYAPNRVVRNRPPFRVGVEPWIVGVAGMLGCGNGIATIGVGSWTDVQGNKMDMCGPTCVDRALNLSTGFVGAKVGSYVFEASTFHPVAGVSQAYTIFPLKRGRIGMDIDHIGTTTERGGACGSRGISGYYMGMNAEYETIRMHSRNMSFAVHEMLCDAHGRKPVIPIPSSRLVSCTQGTREANAKCIHDSASAGERFSVRLSEMAALYISDKIDGASYACVETTVQIEYVFISPQFVAQRISVSSRNNQTGMETRRSPPQLPVLIPTSVQSISGNCERTIAPVAQAALLYSTEQEWWGLEFASIDRQIRFHAYMMAVADSLFPMPTLPKPESSFNNNGTCYIRPCYEVTLIRWTWASILLVVLVSVVSVVGVSAFIFRWFFRGESWVVGSAKWSIDRLLGENDGKNQIDQETLIQAVPIPSDHSVDTEPRDWRYEFRVRSRDLPDDSAQASSAGPFSDPVGFVKRQ